MAEMDSKKVMARLLMSNGADREEPFVFVLEGSEHEIPAGMMNALNLDVGDHIEVKYPEEGRLEIISHSNGADDKEPDFTTCPSCGSTNLLGERRPNGYTICQDCGHKARHSEWGRSDD